MPCKDVAKRYVVSSKNVKENGDDNGKEVDVNLSGLVGDEDNGSCKAAAFCCRHLIRIQAPTLGMTIAMTILITTLMTIIMTITDYSNGDDSSDAHYDDNCKSCKTAAFCYNS